ncbi:unnamed protein product, partial [Meganyctiphanes norvegica]
SVGESDEEPPGKGSHSPLLTRHQSLEGKGVSNSSRVRSAGKRLMSASRSGTTGGQTYQPLVFRSSSANAKIGGDKGDKKDSTENEYKVCTLTFENIYADDESSSDTLSVVKMSSSSDETLSSTTDRISLHRQSLGNLDCDNSHSTCTDITINNHDDRELSLQVETNSQEIPCTNIRKDIYYNSQVPVTSVRRGTTEEREEEHQSSPCSSEGGVLVADMENGDSRSSSPGLDWLFCHSDSDSEFADIARTPEEREQRKSQLGISTCNDKDRWNMIRSSPESPIEVVGATGQSSASQGAIPKKRRQGVILDEPDNGSGSGGSGSGNAAGNREVSVTMEDLVRRLLDILNSSLRDPEQCDIQKLVVLKQRLEQEGGIGGVIGSAGVSLNNNGANDTSYVNNKNSNDKLVEPALYRKPAVRRRRHVAGSATSPPAVCTTDPSDFSLLTTTLTTSLTTTPTTVPSVPMESPFFDQQRNISTQVFLYIFIFFNVNYISIIM